MKTYSIRFLVIVFAFGVGFLVHRLVTPDGPEATVKPDGVREPALTVSEVRGHRQDRSNEILSLLLPNDGAWADVSQLEQFPRSEVIDALKAAPPSASYDRALGIAFLLAALGDDYQSNRTMLLKALDSCRPRGYPHASRCADIISGYLIDLAQRGDTSLFTPLFGVADQSDGDFAESLGVFYSDALSKHPGEFVAALIPLSTKSQDLVCTFASHEDGSGMPDETFREAKQSLNAIGRQNSQLGPVARRCAASLQRGKQQADAN
jgi:hypothetical protein